MESNYTHQKTVISLFVSLLLLHTCTVQSVNLWLYNYIYIIITVYIIIYLYMVMVSKLMVKFIFIHHDI